MHMQAYTFVCLAENEVATTVDIQDLADGAYLRHAQRLLREHASARAIEVWRDERMIDRVERSGAERPASPAA